jgi:hypothetical protein
MDEEEEDWEDGSEDGSAMSEDEDEEEEEDDDDSDSDSSSDDEPATAVAKSRKIPSASEKFFADL